jgi:hypothetical protein
MTVLMSAISPTDCFVLEAGVRLRPVPEFGHCLAYTAARPALHTLNASSWLLAELADGSPVAVIASEYAEAMAEIGGEGATPEVEAGLAELMALGIIRRVPTAT